jgi:hypothetical protein
VQKEISDMQGRIVGFLFAFGALTCQALAQTAGMQSFQGLIKDSAGNAVVGPISLEFRLFDAVIGGNLVDMDGDGLIENTLGQDAKQVLNVTVTNGVVSTKFGPVHPRAFNGAARWLEVRVNGTALSRLEMTTPPAIAEQLNVPGTGSAKVTVSTAGQVGIGTLSPVKALQIGDAATNNSEGMIRLISRSGTGTPSRTWDIGVPETDGTTTGIGYDFVIDDVAAGGTAQPEFIIENGTRNVGIGTSSPQARLDVAGSARMQVCMITGGSDLAEPFDVAANEDDKLEGGMVVAIDPANPGKLALATEPYDRKVAGIISGAKGLKPGMVMRAEGYEHADGRHNVALTGRVWCWCDASFGNIEPGDRLTTSSTAGHGMRASDRERCDGAVIGKAMTPLKEGRGLVLVLVQPQ